MNPISMTPKILAIISFVLLIIAVMSLSIFTMTIEDNNTLRTLLTNIFSNDPKAQRENLDVAVAEGLAADTLVFLKTPFIVLIGYFVLLTIANGAALLLVKRYPYASAVTFIIVGALLFFTVIFPVLLISAGIIILKRIPTKQTYHSNLA